jgi:hypothetical protein
MVQAREWQRNALDKKAGFEERARMLGGKEDSKDFQ